MDGLFGDVSVAELRERAARWSSEELLAAFDERRGYRTAVEWNELVRVCEGLALVGWGDREPLEAFAERWINGSFYTQLRDRRFRPVDGTQRGWARSGATFVLEGEPGSAGSAPGSAGNVPVSGLLSQRIPLAKNPVRIVRSGNFQDEAKPFVDALARLRELFDGRLAKPYGAGFGYFGFSVQFSLPYAGPNLAMEYAHSDGQAPSSPDSRVFYRPKLDAGRLSNRRGEVVYTVTRHYTDAEAKAPLERQKQEFAEDLAAALAGLAKKLQRKAPAYRIGELRADAGAVVDDWLAIACVP